jgi:hypothetical protein
MARIVPKCAVCIRFKSILRVISLTRGLSALGVQLPANPFSKTARRCEPDKAPPGREPKAVRSLSPGNMVFVTPQVVFGKNV